MANRFWITGGTGATNSTTNWSTTTGGTSGATVPGLGDDAIFDSHSGTGTVNMAAALTVHSWDASLAGALTFGGGSTLLVGGQATLTTACILKLAAGQTWSNVATITIDNRSGGTTVTTAAVALPTVTVASTNTAAVVFADSITCTTNNGVINTAGTGGITFTSGTTVTCKTFQPNSATAAITYSGATINCTSTTTAPIFFQAAPTLTGNSSSQLNATAWTIGSCAFSTSHFPGTVTLTSMGNSNPALTMTGAATFTNLTILGAAAAQTSNRITLSAFTGSGTLTITGAAQNQRLACIGNAGSADPAAAPTITWNGSAPALSNVDFQSIKTAGTAGTWTGTSIGRAGGTTGITATSPVTVYWVGGNSGNWSAANKWASTSGGSGGTAGLPLPQDTIVFNAATGGITANNSTVTCDSHFVGALDTSAVAAAGFTIAYGSVLPWTFCGSITLSSASTISATSLISLWFSSDSGTITITQNGGLIKTAVQVAGATKQSLIFSAVTVSGASTWTNISLNPNAGALTISSGNLDAWSFFFTGGTTAFGGYFYTFRGGDSTVKPGFGTNNASAGNVTGLVGAQIRLISTNSACSTGTNVTVDVLDLTGATGTVFITGKVNTIAAPPGLIVTLTSGTTTNIKMLEFIGKGGSLITINATTAASAATLSCASGIINCDWLSLQDCTATGGATFYKGANTTTVSNVTGWTAGSGPARQQLSMMGIGGY